MGDADGICRERGVPAASCGCRSCRDLPPLPALNDIPKFARVRPAYRDGFGAVVRDAGPGPMQIYYIQCGGGPVKIGITADLVRRLDSLQTGHWEDLRVLHWHPGTEADEAALHLKFAHLNIRGEWFEPGPDLLAHIHALEPFQW